MRAALVLVVLRGLCGSAAAEPAPCFDEAHMLSLRIGITSLSRVGERERGTAVTPELELRTWVSPQASLGGYVSHSAYTYQSEYYGVYTPIPIDLTQLGARLAWQAPRFGVGVAFGFGAYREDHAAGPRIREYGQFVGVFADATLVHAGPLGVVFGAHAEVGPATSLTADLGIGWLGW